MPKQVVLKIILSTFKMKILQKITIFSFLIFALPLSAQLLWTEPAFPTAEEKVTVFFDASQGTGGLENCNCIVYVHTGVITNASNSPSDWKYVKMQWGVANPDWAMTRVAGEENIYSYELSPTVRQFYGVPTNEDILKLAFVFRNANGSKEGKDDGGADIFYDLNQGSGLIANILNPSSNQVVLEATETLEIKAVSSQTADLFLYDNGNLIAQNNGTEINFLVENPTSGLHKIQFIADTGSDSDTANFSYIVPLSSNIGFPSDGLDPGIFYLNGTDVRLKLYAPFKQHIFVIGDFNNWELNTDYQMKKDPDGTTHWIDITGLEPGKMYGFQYLVDGETRMADPYCELVLDPWNDGGIDRSDFNGLPDYPAAKTQGIAGILLPGKSTYDWQVTNFQKPKKEELIIYEMLLRDFLAAHDYETLIDTLDYLENLGINAIELMPVSEFEGNNSWGYNPSYHNALDKYYGSPEQFKAFIDECHRRGIAVILDVVYNHAFSQSPLCQLFWDAGNFRPSANSPYFNQVAKHDFNVGYDFNHESAATQYFFKKSVKFWMDEYHIDGFRFDLSKGFTQKNTLGNVSAWGQYDAARVALWKDYSNHIWSIDPNAYVILEHFANNDEETELVNRGMMVWQNMNHESAEASMGYSNNLDGFDYRKRGWSTPSGITYMESHDEERLMYKNKNFGNTRNDYSTKESNTALLRKELVSLFYYTTPGPRMIWQFGELGYDFSINTCEDGVTVDNNCRLARKPIRWDYLTNPNRKRLYDVTRSLTHLRQENELFKINDIDGNLSTGGIRWLTLNGADMDAVVFGNFNVVSGNVNINFPSNGIWYEYFSGEEIEVFGNAQAFELRPGEYHLYTSQKLPEPFSGYISSTGLEEVAPAYFGFKVGPNPAHEQTTVFYTLENSATVEINIFDQKGQLVQPLLFEQQGVGEQQFLIDHLPPTGVYWLQMVVDGKASVLPLVAQ